MRQDVSQLVVQEADEAIHKLVLNVLETRRQVREASSAGHNEKHYIGKLLKCLILLSKYEETIYRLAMCED